MKYDILLITNNKYAINKCNIVPKLSYLIKKLYLIVSCFGNIIKNILHLLQLLVHESNFVTYVKLKK
jgi:hypothetical protein